MSISEDLYDTAEAASSQAGAVQRCPNHDDVLLSKQDAEANKRAYAVAANWAKERGYDRTEMMQAVDAVLADAVFECPYQPCNPDAE